MIKRYFEKLSGYAQGNVLLFRVISFLWGVSLLGVSVAVIIFINESIFSWWIILHSLFLFLASYGLWIMFVSFSGSNEKFLEKSKNIQDGGGEEAALILLVIFLVAIPITKAIEYFYAKNH